MRLALCAEVVDHLDFAAQCAFAQAVGYDALEPEPRQFGSEPHRMPPQRRAELRRITGDHGIAISGLHSILRAPPGLSITSADVAVRHQTLDVMAALCELCADLGGSYLVHGSAEQRSLPKGDAAGGRARAVEAFARAAEAAEAAGVDYLIEPIRPSRTDFIHTVAEAAAIAAEVDRPALRTMLDCCSAAEAESQPIPDLLDRWLPSGMIGHVHLNDPNLRGPGQGALRFGPILAALRRQDYRGTIAVEPFVFVPDGATAAARAVGYVRGLLEGLDLHTD
jgi:sugar phosphate isomerase/epimerase